MQFGKHLMIWLSMFVGLAPSNRIFAQAAPKKIAQQSDYIAPSRVPSHAILLLFTLGDRLQKAGNERMTFTGTETGQKGDTAASFIWELPGKCRFDEGGPQGRSLGFDGSQPWNARAAIADADKDILDTLSTDSTEGYLYQIAQGSPHRVLGQRFRTDDGRSPSYSGPYYDIHEVWSPLSARNDKKMYRKLFYFESWTNQLSRVTYSVTQQGKPVKVVILRSDWRTVNGQPVPGRIERTEDGKTVFSLLVTNVQFSSKVADNIFAQR